MFFCHGAYATVHHMPPELQSMADEFNIRFSNAEASENAILSKVYILDGSHILRSRALTDTTVSKFEREQQLIETIRPQIGLEMPVPVPTKAGLPYLIKDGTMWTMYPMIKGHVYCTWFDLERLPLRARENLYTTLHQLHENTRGKLHALSTGRDFLADIKKWLEMIPEGTIQREDSDRVRKACEIVASVETAEDSLCFVHGDFQPGNIVYRDEKPVGLLDLDWARKGNPLEDISYTLMTMMRDYTKPYEFNRTEWERGLALYPLPEEQLPLFKEYMILSCFYDLYLFRSLQEISYKPHILPYQIAFLEDMRAHF